MRDFKLCVDYSSTDGNVFIAESCTSGVKEAVRADCVTDILAAVEGYLRCYVMEEGD